MTEKDKFSEQDIDELENEEAQESDFDWLANVYNRQGAINHPSELHGLLLGEITGGIKRTANDFLAQVLEHMGVDELNVAAQANVVEDLLAFYSQVSEGIDKDSSSFTLLLPDDDYVLSERLEAMVLWVRGFLEGIAISASERLNSASKDLEEILKDLVEICQLDPRVEPTEEGEREFFEVVEYVRVGVLNLYAEFNQPEVEDSTEEKAAISDIDPDTPTLH
ncbi:hypothetical protein A3752_24560 [Oleiphilus sp. HI0081]|jgi:yecA family protein|uniref:UPF0149 family protein n=4 Tax=Oleiphilus TaxID=141450 RepID=UPI0007C2FE93|nr:MULTISPECIES: UPF0149 family protein [unclassified Oleiphilus]KZY74700.1 hypothetical protein A3740_16385 [Oleiphilus sp. HI0068]KZY84707.1 hypothetical protein A3741_15985 [Oleiphilus sp. HI0069]KZY95813.1 hypothetical protein A3743_05150 [Oleiphilus sp. HI0072]KZZ09527.1 hypothetical protein A3749_13410 [Oleiphilus sp. HI0078]KZZ25313.1 hypothetical protein A3752_24560 [Oleiphilus sp. HI0081]